MFVALWLVGDEDRRESFRTESQMIRQAYLTNYAVNGPDKLRSEVVDLQKRMTAGAVATEANDAALREAREALEAQRKARGIA